MRADASPTANNVATIVFDVVIDAGVVDGTMISNQGFVGASDGGVPEQPSDDPDTAIPDDPTRDVVGNRAAALRAEERGAAGRRGHAGVVDPGDVLRYTITVYNNGARPGDRRRAPRRRAREHDLRRGLHDPERSARGPAGRRRLAARRGHPDQLVRSHAAAAGPERGSSPSARPR